MGLANSNYDLVGYPIWVNMCRSKTPCVSQSPITSPKLVYIQWVSILVHVTGKAMKTMLKRVQWQPGWYLAGSKPWLRRFRSWTKSMRWKRKSFSSSSRMDPWLFSKLFHLAIMYDDKILFTFNRRAFLKAVSEMNKSRGSLLHRSFFQNDSNPVYRCKFHLSFAVIFQLPQDI